uniref:Uncharacterized protein n=1 Tax=Populus trichocarpa TaxID=3694 RepID=A0A2K1XG00_POPTR
MICFQIHSQAISSMEQRTPCFANKLDGSLPAELGNCSSLVLFLSNNAQDWEMGRLSNLKILTLYSNNLTGRIASEITNFTKLTYLSLAHINLTGEIPSELGNVHQIYID